MGFAGTHWLGRLWGCPSDQVILTKIVKVSVSVRPPMPLPFKTDPVFPCVRMESGFQVVPVLFGAVVNAALDLPRLIPVLAVGFDGGADDLFHALPLDRGDRHRNTIAAAELGR